MSVLGYFRTGNPKSMTQLDANHPQRTSLIGICKKMIFRMDPMRAVGLQGLAAETSLATHKYSSSIVCWIILRNFQEGESFLNKNTNCKPWLQWSDASGEASCPPFIAAWASLDKVPWTLLIYAAITGAIVQILYTVNVHVSVQQRDKHPGFYFLRILRVQSVWHIQLYHFSGILPEKGVFSDIGSD